MSTIALQVLCGLILSGACMTFMYSIMAFGGSRHHEELRAWAASVSLIIAFVMGFCIVALHI